jgi:hypothetical protein
MQNTKRPKFEYGRVNCEYIPSTLGRFVFCLFTREAIAEIHAKRIHVFPTNFLFIARFKDCYAIFLVIYFDLPISCKQLFTIFLLDRKQYFTIAPRANF